MESSPEQHNRFSDLEKEKIIAALRELFSQSTDDERSRIVKALAKDVNIRPAGWRRRSNAPYYRKVFAEELKSVIDTMMQELEAGNPVDKIFFYEASEMSPNTLYLKINQSKMYLLEEMDQDKKYKDFFEKIAISRERGVGIRLSYNRSLLSVNPSANAESVVPKKEQNAAWKDKVEDFLDNSIGGEELNIRSIALTQDDISTLRISLQTLDDIIFKITYNQIYIRKMTDVEVAAMKQQTNNQ